MLLLLKRPTYIFVLGLLILFTSCKNDEKKIYIDVNVPTTGPISAWSGQFPNGFLFGIEKGCQKYNVDPNVFSIDFQDNGGKETEAITSFQKQKIDGYDVFVSVSTVPVNAFADQIDQSDKPHFIAAFDPFITEETDERFRVMANSKIEAPLFVDYALKKNAQNVFIAQLNWAYAEQEFGQIVEKQLIGKGVSVIREKFEIGDRDFKSIAAKIKSANPDLIYLAGYSFHLQPLLRDLRSANLIEKGKVVCVMDFVDLMYNNTPLEELKDVIFISPSFEVKGKIEGVDAWKNEYKEKYNVSPTYVPAYAYDNAMLIVKAFAEFGEVTDETLKKAVPFQGINGIIDLDEDEDIISTITVATLNEKGEVVELGM